MLERRENALFALSSISRADARGGAARQQRARAGGDRVTGEIGGGLLAFIGVGTHDDETDATALAHKTSSCASFPTTPA